MIDSANSDFSLTKCGHWRKAEHYQIQLCNYKLQLYSQSKYWKIIETMIKGIISNKLKYALQSCLYIKIHILNTLLIQERPNMSFLWIWFICQWQIFLNMKSNTLCFHSLTSNSATLWISPREGLSLFPLHLTLLSFCLSASPPHSHTHIHTHLLYFFSSFPINSEPSGCL